MSLFICDRCGVVENTGLGSYWAYRFGELFQNPSDNELALCSLCAPPKYADGTINTKGGGWHDKFRREFPDKAEVLKIGLGNFKTTKKLKEILN